MGFLSNVVSAGIAAGRAEREAERIRDASDRAVATTEAGRQRGIDAIRAGTQAQLDQLRPQLATAVPGVLDAAERQTREDLLRQGTRDLGAAGLRGAGRSGIAILRDADRRLLQGFDEADEARLARLRETIGSVQAGEGRDVANIETGQAAQAAHAIQTGASRAAQPSIAAGATIGQSIVDTTSSLLGQLGSLAAQEEKARSNRTFAGGRV